MQEYKILQRALTGGPSVVLPDGNMEAQNVLEFVAYLQEHYLDKGFEVKSRTLLAYIPPTPTNPVERSLWSYELVREKTEKASKEKNVS